MDLVNTLFRPSLRLRTDLLNGVLTIDLALIHLTAELPLHAAAAFFRQSLSQLGRSLTFQGGADNKSLIDLRANNRIKISI